jgi:hypothetical protein
MARRLRSKSRLKGVAQRTHACRVHNRVNAFRVREQCSHECEHSTQECVRHIEP